MKNIIGGTIGSIILLGMMGWTIFNFIQYTSEKSSNVEIEKLESQHKTEEVAVGSVKDEQAPVGLKVGEVAPNFELTSLDGEVVKLSDYRGKRVFLNFWATWCPPCRVEMPDFQKIHDEEDVVVLGINLTKEEVDVDFVQGFMDYYKLDFPVLLDKDLKIAMRYSIKPIPTTYLIDSKGVIQDIAYGPMIYDSMIEGLNKMN